MSPRQAWYRIAKIHPHPGVNVNKPLEFLLKEQTRRAALLVTNPPCSKWTLLQNSTLCQPPTLHHPSFWTSVSISCIVEKKKKKMHFQPPIIIRILRRKRHSLNDFFYSTKPINVIFVIFLGHWVICILSIK